MSDRGLFDIMAARYLEAAPEGRERNYRALGVAAVAGGLAVLAIWVFAAVLFLI